MESLSDNIKRYLEVHHEWLESIDNDELTAKLDGVLIDLLLRVDIALMRKEEIEKSPQVTQWVLEKSYVYNDVTETDKDSPVLPKPHEVVRELFEHNLIAPLVHILEDTDSVQRELISSILMRCIFIGGTDYARMIIEYEAVPTLVRLYSSDLIDSEDEEESDDSVIGPNETLPFNLLMLLCGFSVHAIVANKPEPVVFCRPVLTQLAAVYATNPKVVEVLVDRLDPYTMSHAAFAGFLFILDQFYEVLAKTQHFKKVQQLDIIRKCEIFIRTHANGKQQHLHMIYLSSVMRSMGIWMFQSVELIPRTMFDENIFTSLSHVLLVPGHYAIAHHALGIIVMCARYFPHYRRLIGATLTSQIVTPLLKKSDTKLVGGTIELLHYLFSDDTNNHLAIAEIISALAALLSDDMSNKQIGTILKIFKTIIGKLPLSHSHFKALGLVDYLICPVLGERNEHQSTAIEILKLLKVDVLLYNYAK